MNEISRIYYYNKKIRNELRKNQSNSWISYIRMHQEYISVSETDRILLKIHYKFYQHYYIIDWFIMKRQIIQVNRITEISIQRNKRKVQKEINTDIF